MGGETLDKFLIFTLHSINPDINSLNYPDLSLMIFQY